MATKNPITGDLIKSKSQSDAYASGWDAIFGKKSVQEVVESVPKTEEDLKRYAALDELVKISQEMGMYDIK